MLVIMKAVAMSALVAGVCLAFQLSGQAQYKAPSQYFPKSFPAPSAAGRASPAGTNAPVQQPPAQRVQPKFKDLPLSTGFYFMSDTNRAYLWTKTSTSQAKNTKNGVLQTIGNETPVQK